MRFRVDRRPPGIRFESRPPPLPDALPRMDVAVFVGFAASGPLHTPVAIDDVQELANVFGDDIMLGWDGEAGGMIRGNLGPAVRAFFRNGGRRCWVIRVAGEARSSRFPIPGLARWSGGALLPAGAVARSEGSWSDDVAVSASLAAQPVGLVALELGDAGRALAARLVTSDDVAVGDQLRIALDGGSVLVAAIADIDGDLARFAHGATLWLTTALPVSPDPAALAIDWFPSSDLEGEPVPQPLAPAGSPRWSADTLIVPVAPPAPVSPDEPELEPGHLVRLRWGGEEVWLSVDDLVLTEDGSPPRGAIELHGGWIRRLPGPAPGPGSLGPQGLSAERVRLSLWVQRGTARPVRLDDLGMTPGHGSYLGALPTDRSLFATERRFAPSDRDPDLRQLAHQLQTLLGDAVDPREHYAALWQRVTTPRFPLAIAAPVDAFVPIAMPLLPSAYLGAQSTRETALARDGLAGFGPALFLDPDLGDEPTGTLMAEADFLRWQSSAPRPLIGIHAALGIDEATLIAVPDAVHRGWTMASDVPPMVLPPPALVAAPADGQTWQLSWNAIDDGARYTVERAPSDAFIAPKVVWTGDATASRLTDQPPGTSWFRVRAVSGATVSPWSNAIALPVPPPQFQDCPGAPALPAPVITALPPDVRGNVELSWTDVAGADGYTVEELVGGDDASTPVYQGREHAVTLRGRLPGAYAYRARASRGATLGAWSNAAIATVPPQRRNLIARVGDFQPDQVLRPVHRAVMRLAAARGDLLAVLTLPAHFRAPEAAAHVAWLRAPAGEESTWSYAALYHPWLIGDDLPGTASSPVLPPDGAVCGMMAQRASARGAWIAPANEPLRGAIELIPILSDQDASRFADAQVNLLRDEPHGLVALSADTLARDPDLAAIHVRRLLILLRRIALRVGPGYVFEPSGAVFQRLVQRGFEAVLDDLFARGAFAGAERNAAYQLAVDATASVADQGRFVVEIKVAPSQPMSFLTVRLIQSGDLGVVTEAR